MTPLRSRLIEEITLRNYSPRTVEAYVHAVYCLAQHYHRSPDTLSDPELRQYLLHLHLNTGKSASTLNVAVSGLRFFYQRVLHRPFYHLERDLPRPRQPKRRPKAYSLAEVRKLIGTCVHPKHRAFLLTVYGAGLRLNEACHLRPEHIERDARMIRVEQGKGRKDRYTVLPDYSRRHRLPARHWKVLNAMQACRTPLLGGHQYFCAHCRTAHFAPHGCGNRHCPTCQGIHSRQWLGAQQELLLPIPYFHLVFTLPHALNPLIQQNQKPLYNLLFAAVSETLLTFGRNNLGAQLGVTAVLHTWSQTLLDHYHLHCIVTGGGPALDGSRWVHSRPDYLFNVGALSQVFRAKLCQGLQALYQKGELQFHGQLEPQGSPAAFGKLLREVRDKGWVVYSKRPFAGPRQVLAYLSRYTHRVGISNRRLLNLDRQSGSVAFDYKDYAQGGRHKTMELGLNEFIRRLCLHFLPAHLVKIRHYGLLANRGRAERLAKARALLGVSPPPPKAPQERTLPRCPRCGWAALFLVEVIPPLRWQSPPVPTDTS
ncbi:MAG TPA: IS91 family transposase [Verrucomicrobiae bacterium]